MAVPDLQALPDLPLDEEGPVFREPWEARAFALAIRLQEQGLFTWNEWAEQLGTAIEKARSQGDEDRGDTYYEHWLACLETLAMSKGLVDKTSLAEGKQKAHEDHQRLHAHR